MSDNSQSLKIEYATKVVLTVIFLGLLALFIRWKLTSGQPLYQPTPLDYVLLVFATLRMGRMIAFDLVMQPFRAPFTRTVPDPTGAGDTVEPRGTGVQQAIGQLISCPICAGTWSAGLLVCFLFAWPDAAHIFLFVLAAIGAAEVLNSFAELLCWRGDLARARAGQIYKANQEESKRAAQE